MKFLKTALVAVGALALLASPARAQYGSYDDDDDNTPQQQQQQQESTGPSQERKGVQGYFDLAKALVLGGNPPPIFEADPTGAIINITDASYKDVIFQDEYIIVFCSQTSAPCADYFPTFLDAAITLNNETHTKFAAVWVEDNARIAARFFVPARLPFLVYAKDGDFRQIPYVRNDTQYLVNFIEEEKYKYYPLLSGPMGPYSTMSHYFEKYAEGMEWVGQYTGWMPKWLVYVIAGSMSGVVFSLFSGGSNYSSDPSKYPHLNPDGTLKDTTANSITGGDSKSTTASASGSSTGTKSKSSSKKRSATKKA